MKKKSNNLRNKDDISMNELKKKFGDQTCNQYKRPTKKKIRKKKL